MGEMLYALTVVGPDPDAVARAGEWAAARAVTTAACEVKSASSLGPGGFDILVAASSQAGLSEIAREAADGRAVDVCLQPQAGRRKRLFLADMDSTIIGCECLDELADYAGVKAEVAEITERAMRGEIAFEGALIERVGRLRGLSLQALARCYEERVRLNPGACTLVATLAAHGVRCVLVSGGFDAFTAPVATQVGFQVQHANRLLSQDGRLTGEVARPILGREAKLQALQRHAAELGLALDAALAVGDGANDLAMIGAAGLGVAYRAKPVVAAQADLRLDHADLDALLYVQGYRVEDFLSA